MLSVSPHLYRKLGAEQGVDPAIVERAITQARPPEKHDLPAILTLRHFSHITGANYNYLREIVERKRDPYKPFLIRKRRGGFRSIAAPEPVLQEVQRWITDKILNKLTSHYASCAYAPKSSPVECAKRHLGSSWIIKVDIHDFFENISERSVYQVFRNAGYQPLVSFELARLCTRLPHGIEASNPKWRVERRADGIIKPYRSKRMGHLPQGAPTSPMLSNLASYKLDKSLQCLADRHLLTFTRYSDDVIFSAGLNFDSKLVSSILVESERIFESHGHKLHRKKTSVAPPGARKIALGLLVDGDRARLTKEYRNRLSDHVRGIEKFGLMSHANERHFASIWGMVRHIQGLLSYGIAVEGAEAMDSLLLRFKSALASQGWPKLPEI